jgi:hypothetical protein
MRYRVYIAFVIEIEPGNGKRGGDDYLGYQRRSLG